MNAGQVGMISQDDLNRMAGLYHPNGRQHMKAESVAQARGGAALSALFPNSQSNAATATQPYLENIDILLGSSQGLGLQQHQHLAAATASHSMDSFGQMSAVASQDPMQSLLMAPTDPVIINQQLAGFNFPDFTLLAPGIGAGVEGEAGYVSPTDSNNSGGNVMMEDVGEISSSSKSAEHKVNLTLRNSAAIRGGLDLGQMFDLDDGSNNKAEAIRQRNREHARKSRMRKRLYLEQLQSAVDRLTQEQRKYEELLAKRAVDLEKVKMIEEKNRQLEEQNKRLASVPSSPISPFVDLPQQNIQKAIMFMDQMSACVSWREMAKEFVPDAPFICDAFRPLKTVKEFVDVMFNLHRHVLSQLHYENYSVAQHENRITVTAFLMGVHDKPAGPLLPTNPPKRFKTMSVYTFHFNVDGLISQIDKVWDLYSTLTQLGWPVPDDLDAFCLSLGTPPPNAQAH